VNEASVETFEELLGETLESVGPSLDGEELLLITKSGKRFRFFHKKDCSEYVRIEDIVGDLTDLIGSPLLVAEEISSEDYPRPSQKYDSSYTWTFYRFSTAKGTVTVRWLGESNGYYSESVSFEEIK